ncbi:MAG: hypothetical protein NUV51_07575, partial [Sulfuricaulis sp.]|nr:hypothetical protein [Sulfuricaulis sp.]
ITRMWKVKQPNDYLLTAGTIQNIGGEQKLTRQHTVTEFMMNALRLNRGFPSRLFAERTGLPISTVVKPLQEAEQKGLITWDTETLRPTDTGLRFLNNLVAMF